VLDKNFLKEHHRVVQILKKLKNSPPRVLVLEGGLKKDREQLGRYWCSLLNCLEDPKPCLCCRRCSEIFNDRFPDIIILDGQNDSIKMEDVQVIQREKDHMPREGNFRIFLFNEAQNLSISAANSLLKVLEEPKDRNLFVLLVPQRINLLSTIQSRSFILTLKWKAPIYKNEEVERITEQLVRFWKDGKGLFEITQKKMDKEVIKSVIFIIQQSIFESVLDNRAGSLEVFFRERITGENLWKLTYTLEHSLYMLQCNVSPTAVFEWMALNLYKWFA
jgi:hypothetical protein